LVCLLAKPRSRDWSGRADIWKGGRDGGAEQSQADTSRLSSGGHQAWLDVAREALHLRDGLLTHHAREVGKDRDVLEPEVLLQAGDVLSDFVGGTDQPRTLLDRLLERRDAPVNPRFSVLVGVGLT